MSRERRPQLDKGRVRSLSPNRVPCSVQADRVQFPAIPMAHDHLSIVGQIADTSGVAALQALSMTSMGALALLALSAPALAQELCAGYGPQTPRDISQTDGLNQPLFTLAPDASEMNLCNIHAHLGAEHKGPGFSVAKSSDARDGYVCNEASTLTPAELEEFAEEVEVFENVKPGDTVEVHWVYTSCDVAPGPGLAACASTACTNPELRVEAQVFLVVNNSKALDFTDFAYEGNIVDGRHQAKSLPTETGDPVVFAGSTTGEAYSHQICSPLAATWSVRPACAKLDIGSLQRWSEGKLVFAETEAHAVRELVTAPELLAPIE